MIKRTEAEIVARIKEAEGNMFLGMTLEDFLAYLPYEAAREFLAPGITRQKYADSGMLEEYTEAVIRKKMADYLPFAMKKASDQRGLSAMRSMQHYHNWFWLMGDQAIESIGDLLTYDDYGLKNLERIRGFLNG